MNTTGLRRRGTARGLRGHLICGMLLSGITLEAQATDVAAALPHTLHRGAPRGWASTEGVDWARSYLMADAPSPRAARALWQAQVPGGVSCNVLVDDEGRVFAAGQGHVTQLSREGAREYSRLTGNPAALTATLLADGTRVVLTLDGHVVAWSRSGKTRFSLELEAQPPGARGTLLPLPDGGVLVSLGARLFEIETGGAMRGRAVLKHAIDHTLIAQERSVIIDDSGAVMTWDGESPPERRGSFGGRVTRVVTRGPSSLVGLSTDRGLIELSLETGEVTLLAGGEKGGLLPVLARSANESFAVMTADGIAFLQGAGTLPTPGPSRASKPDRVGQAHLLASPDGTLVSFTSNAALRLQKGAESHELPDVRCGHPVSLVPAGPSRVVAACSSGQLWLIGGQAASAPALGAAPSLRR